MHRAWHIALSKWKLLLEKMKKVIPLASRSSAWGETVGVRDCLLSLRLALTAIPQAPFPDRTACGGRV